MRTRILLSVLLFAVVGCHAQLTPSPAPSETITWTVPAASSSWLGCGSGQPACTFVVSRATVATGTASCPATNASNYTPLETATTGLTAETYTDSGAAGDVCYVVQIVQAGLISAPSSASNGGVPTPVPAVPLAPTITTIAARNEAPEIAPTMAPELARLAVPVAVRAGQTGR